MGSNLHPCSGKPNPYRKGYRKMVNTLMMIPDSRYHHRMSNHQTIRFQLALSPEQFLRFYQGIAKNITTRADDGRVINFPAQNVKQFLAHDGIHGSFEMALTHDHKFISVKRLAR